MTIMKDEDDAGNVNHASSSSILPRPLNSHCNSEKNQMIDTAVDGCEPGTEEQLKLETNVTTSNGSLPVTKYSAENNFFEETCYNLASLLPNLEDAAHAATCGTIAGALMLDDLCAAETKADLRVQRALLNKREEEGSNAENKDSNQTMGLPSCVLCYNPKKDFCVFPCCTDRPLVCFKCMNVLSFDTHHVKGNDDTSTVPHDEEFHKIAHCPLCQRWISIHSPQHINKLADKGTCTICNQFKSPLVLDQNSNSLVDEEQFPDDESRDKENELNDDSENIHRNSTTGICDACFLGKAMPLSYECSECGGTQRIPHPMYRYQLNPGSFSSNTWKCHLKCTGFTKWRISAEEMFLIPPGDQPASWNVNYLQSARDKILAENSLSYVANGDTNGVVAAKSHELNAESNNTINRNSASASNDENTNQQECIIQ